MTEPVLSIRDLSVRHGARIVLSSITAKVWPGELIGLIGPNGAGKTTLLRAAMGLLPLVAGQVRILGRSLTTWTPAALGRQLAYMPQGGEEAWPINVDRFVGLGRLPHLEPWRGPAPEDLRIIRDAMTVSDVARLATRPVTALSGGERARVHLARALAVGAPILFADEPIAGLDPYHQLQVMEMLRQQADIHHRTVVAVLHDLTLAHRFCHRLLLIKDGRLYAEGTPETVLTPRALSEAYNVRPARPADLDNIVIPWRPDDAQG